MTLLRRSWFLPLLLVAYALRILNLTGESLWRDEVDIVRFATLPLSNLVQNFPRAGFNGPLYLLLMRGWFDLVGISDFSLRYFSLVFSVLLIALVYVLARRLFGVSAARLSTLFMVVSPVHIWYAGEGKMYTLQPALLILALYALVRALAQTNRSPDFTQTPSKHTSLWWITLLLSASMAFYVHLLSPIVILVLAVWVGLNWSLARQSLRPLLITLGLLTGPYVPLLIWQWPTLLKGGSSGHAFVPLDTLLNALLYDWSIGFGSGAPLFFMLQPEQVRWVTAGLFLALAGLGAALRLSSAPRAIGMTVSWLFLPALAVFAISLRVPVFQPRYLLWCAPALYVLMGNLAATPHPARWFMRAAMALSIAVAVLGVAAQISTPIRPDIRGASAFIASHAQPGDVLIFQIPYGRYGVEYYLQHSAFSLQLSGLGIAEAPYTNYGMSQAELANELWRGIGPAQRIWLVETEAEMWDEQGLVRAWFDQTLPLVQKMDFRGVRLSLHQTTLDKRLYVPTMQR